MKVSELPQDTENELIRNYLLTHLGDKGLDVEYVENDFTTRLYHISTNPKIPYFEPRFSTKLYPNENVQVPRTSTSPSIGQCLQGYGPIHNENNAGGWGNKETRENWNGLYYVYEPEWRNAIKPSKEMVGDVEWSDEHWLIYYKPEHYKRRTSISASFFLQGVSTIFKGKEKQYTLTLYVRVTNKKGVMFSPDIFLRQGAYRIELINYKSPEFKYVLNENTFIDQIDDRKYRWAYAQRTTKNETNK